MFGSARLMGPEPRRSARRAPALLGLMVLLAGPGCDSNPNGPGVAPAVENAQSTADPLPAGKSVKTSKGRLVVDGAAGGTGVSK